MDQIVLGNGFERLSSFAPSGEAANDHECIESLLPQQVRHPGARRFSCSSAIDINIFVPGQRLDFLPEAVRFETDRALNPRGSRIVVAMAANIDHDGTLGVLRS
jgi:hypothetical protein